MDEITVGWEERGKITFCDVLHVSFITEASDGHKSVNVPAENRGAPPRTYGIPNWEWGRQVRRSPARDSLCELPGRCARISVYHLFVLGSPLVANGDKD